MTYEQAHNHLTSTIDDWFLLYFEGEDFLEFCTSIEPIIEDMVIELENLGTQTPRVVVLDVLRQWHNAQATKAM